METTSEDFTVSLFRDGTRVDAADSVVVLPPGFEIVAPIASEVYRRSADAITVTWEPTSTGGETMRLSVVTSCIDGSSHEYEQAITGDPGTATLAAGSLEGNGQCNSLIEVARSAVGTLDRAFGNGGVIAAHQVRSVAVVTTD